MPLGSRWTLSGGGAGAAALEGGAGWISGDLSLVGRRPVGRMGTLELSTSLAAFRVSSSNVYEAFVARVTPTWRWRVGRSAEVALRGHGGLGRSVSRLGGSAIDLEEDLSLVGAGTEASAQLGPVRLKASTDVYRAMERTTWSVVGGGEAPLGPARLEAWLQRWSDAEDEDRFVFLVGLSVPLGARTSFRSSGGRSAPDPLLGTLPGTYGSALLRVELPWGGPAPEIPAATLSGTPDGTVEFRWRGEATSVDVLGDFTGWTPIPLTNEDGVWTVASDVAPGLHHFGFRVDGTWTMSERVLGRTLDEWGHPQGTLVVPEASRAGTAPVPPGDPLGGRVPEGDAPRIRERLTAAARDGVPTEPLLGRALEGRAKGVPLEEVLRGLDDYAERLRRARALLGVGPTPAEITAAADALGRGAPAQALEEMAAAVATPARAMALVALGDLVGDGVPVMAAFDVVHAAAAGEEAPELLGAVPPVVRGLVSRGSTAEEAALRVEDAIARGVPPPFVELGAWGGAGKPPVPPGTGAPRMMGGMMGPGGR